ncbi:AAA family ATPase [bacterium]|nr:AAA family ATPase [bacterium]
MSSTVSASSRQELLAHAKQVVEQLRHRLTFAVRGRDEVIDLILIALLADGHVLLEDHPGSGKTTLAKALGESFEDNNPTEFIEPFRRVQFTPDLLPSDVTGVSVFDPESQQFHFRPGPIFAHVLLADEINRTSPKVQSALLEAMAEKQVTVDNHTYPLDDLFFVIATQNPRDQVGTYPLPVAQLDRFLFKIRMDYIERSAEVDVLRSYRDRRQQAPDNAPKVTRDALIEARNILDEHVYIDPRLSDSLVDVATALRQSPQVAQGVSTRSLVLLLPALQALAFVKGRDFVTPEDVSTLAPHVFAHRLELVPGVEDVREVVKKCLKAPLESLSRSTMR